MRIQVTMASTGLAYFPGLARPVTIESQDLPEQEAATVERLVGAARFFALPAVVGAASGPTPDARQYTVTIEDGARQHTVRISDPAEDPDLRALLDYLKDKVREAR